MARQGPFDVGKTVKLLNQTRQIELATVVYNTRARSAVRTIQRRRDEAETHHREASPRNIVRSHPRRRAMPT